MRTAMLLGALMIASAADAANLSKLDAMVKQGNKFGAGIEKAKVLCICHVADGSSRLGFVGAFASSFPVATQVHVQCYVPTYDANGDATVTQTCVGGAGGVSWEIVK